MEIGQLLQLVVAHPIQGGFIASTAGLVAMIIYLLRRNDDDEPVRWPTVLTLVILIVATLVLGILTFFPMKPKPAPPKPPPVKPHPTKNQTCLDLTAIFLIAHDNFKQIYVQSVPGTRPNANSFDFVAQRFDDSDDCLVDGRPDHVYYRCKYALGNNDLAQEKLSWFETQLTKCFFVSAGAPDNPADKAEYLEIHDNPTFGTARIRLDVMDSAFYFWVVKPKPK